MTDTLTKWSNEMGRLSAKVAYTKWLAHLSFLCEKILQLETWNLSEFGLFLTSCLPESLLLQCLDTNYFSNDFYLLKECFLDQVKMLLSKVKMAQLVDCRLISWESSRMITGIPRATCWAYDVWHQIINWNRTVNYYYTANKILATLITLITCDQDKILRAAPVFSLD